ncbi:MAG TPA: sigma-70 family RNA polymerase sigma factor, partial [Bryobacteraceae bacterium]|nr:sigma-70 family RNA polymerase sigma factor [Bryobacteraceae bacterium]
MERDIGTNRYRSIRAVLVLSAARAMVASLLVLADITDLEAHRTALTGHCYRMLGSPADADDAVQDTMLRAWRSLDKFDGRASVRTWLYRIATNVCLDFLADRKRRFRPMETASVGTVHDVLVRQPRTHWLEPVPDLAAIPSDSDPAQAMVLRQSIRLAFVAALQYLPPKQRAVLLLVDVLGWSPAEVAESLDTSLAGVTSALQRARATIASRNLAEPAPVAESQRELLDRYVDAFHRYDVDMLTSLLHEEATFSMPPYALWLQGREPVKEWLLGRGSACRGSRLLPVIANGAPAFGQYRVQQDGGYKPFALIVLEVTDGA